MRIYRFRVLIDDPSKAFRDIEIGSEQSFLDLHKAIKESFAFKGEEMACFYVSDEDWNKGPEIPLADLGFAEEGTVPALMEEVFISDHIRSTQQRFIYAYDFLHMWMFVLELIGADDPKPGVTYPRVVMSMGTPPDEHSREDEFTRPMTEDEEEGGYSPGEDEFLYEEDDDGEVDSDDDFGRHGNIDDLGDEYR